MTARTPSMTSVASVTLTPLFGLPEVRQGDDIAGLVLEALQRNATHLVDGDILVVSSKVISKAMGLRAPASEVGEVVLSQTVRVVAERMTPTGVTRIVESAAGPVMTAAGVDASNTADESTVLVLPDDPDAVAAQIRHGVQDGWAARSGTHVAVGVVVSDTSGRPWRIGQTDFALGASGIRVIDDLRGSTDSGGRVLATTERCVADEIAAAADLVKGKTAGVPAAHLRGLSRYVYGESPEGESAEGKSAEGKSAEGARDLIRTGPGDWFGYGMVEAVRAALGVEPGSAAAAQVGIPSVVPEDVATRAGRALRTALLTCPGVGGQVDGDTIRLEAADDFALGVAAARTEVALHGEGLTTTHPRAAGEPPTPLPTPTVSHDGLTAGRRVLIVFQ